MPDDYKIKHIEILSDGESMLSLLTDKKDRARFKVSDGLFWFSENGKQGLQMATIGNLSKSTINLYPDNVTQETSHHYAVIGAYMFMFGLDNTTGFPAVYRSTNGTSWTKIKDFGTPYDESGSMWARGATLFVTFGSGAGEKSSYSTDYGATWSTPATWSYVYPYEHWNFPDGMYFDVGTKIMRTSDGFTMEDFWNYSTVDPYDLEYFNSFIYAFGIRTGELKTLSFGRLENGRYNEIERFSGGEFPAMGRVDDYIVLSFIKKGRIQIYAYDLENIYQIGDIAAPAGGTYISVRTAGRDIAGSLYLLASNGTNSLDTRHQFQITNSLGIFKNRTWPTNYYAEDIFNFGGVDYWVISDSTAGKIYLCKDDSNVMNSLVASVTLQTDYIDIGEHIPIGIRVHHSGGLAESGVQENMIITAFLDLWGDALTIDLGVCDCANENVALANRTLDGSESFGIYDFANAVMATNFRFTKDKINKGDRVFFTIQMVADTNDFAYTPILYGIDYIYKPVDFGAL